MAITLPTNTICNNIAHNVAFNANYDIVWSFDYSLSGNNSSQGSFTTFLFDGEVVLTGGAPGPGGAYYSAGEYLSGSDTLNLLSVSGAVLGINFDTTGLFSLSSGVVNGLTAPIPNSINIRYGETDFEYLTSVSLSSLYTDFSLLLSSQDYNRLRFRLTDIGQTVKVDYKVSNEYQEILNIPVSLNINDSTSYKIGVGYTSPVSGAGASQAIFSIRDFHVEGKTDTPEYDIIETIDNSFAVLPVCALPGDELPDIPTITRTLSRIPDTTCPVLDESTSDRSICLADFINLSGNEAFSVSGLSIIGTYLLSVSAPPAPLPEVVPPPIIEACSTSFSDTISFNGRTRDIVSFPISYTTIIGANTGRVGLDYEVYDQSVRFEVIYDETQVIDTGYINLSPDATYNLNRELALRGLTTGSIAALSSNVVYFNKTASSPTSAEVRVYGPVDGANYTFALLCPTPVPETYPCGTLITGTNYTSPLSSDYVYTPLTIDIGSETGTITFFYSAYGLPERFQVIYNNEVAVDTGWVGLSAQQYIDWLNSYLLRVGQPTVETLYSGNSSVSIPKPDADIETMEVRVYAPLYGSIWAVSAGCPGTPYSPAFIPAAFVTDHIETFP